MTKDLAIERDVPLAPLTTLELGGPARWFLRARTEDELRNALRWAADEDCSVAILGGGSNSIVPDEGFDGLVVHIGLEDLAFGEDGRVEAGAGVPWERVVDGAVARGWAGLECLTGIPGSTGATPIQNVGAYGQEVADVLSRIDVLDRNEMRLRHMAPEDCGFGYRDSRFKREPDRFVVCRVHFELRPDGPALIRYDELRSEVSDGAPLGDVRDAVLRLRRRKSMVLDPDDPNRRSAGSFFLNPIVSEEEASRIIAQALSEGLVPDASQVPQFDVGSGRVKLAAGWLIERAGIAKGTRRGPVGVSNRHALALVHHGGGTTRALLALAEEIQTRVRDRFGVELSREPRLLASGS